MMFRRVLLLIGMIFGVYGQKCGHYYRDGGVCVNYISKDDYVIYGEGQNVLDVENQFQSLAIAQGLSTLRSEDLFLEHCVQDFTSFICAIAFPKCDLISNSNLVNIVPPCLSTCTNVKESCETNLQSAPVETQGIIKTYILSSTYYPKDCSGNISTLSPFNFNYTTEECNNSPQLFNRPKCFQPLIEDRKWVETNKSEFLDKVFCKRGCCLPCPQTYALYPSGQMDKSFLATQILRALSAIGSGIMLISYMVLPGKRAHPSVMILFASLSIFLYSSNVFFSIGKPEVVQCANGANGVTPSTQQNNPFFCGFQGALLVFSSHATAIWIGFIILNLHIHTVWNSNIMTNKYIYLNIIGWGTPALLTVIALGSGAIGFQFGTLCFVKVDSSNLLFFYPLAIVVVPSFFIHMFTFIYLYKISNQEESDSSKTSHASFSEYTTRRRHVIQAIKIQWRALLLAVIFLSTVIYYWIFYFIELNKIVDGTENKSFFEQWTLCIQSGKGQNYCAKNVAKNFMPPYSLMLTAEMSTSLIGIYLIVIFANKALWIEWKQWIDEKFNPIKETDEFFAI